MSRENKEIFLRADSRLSFEVDQLLSGDLEDLKFALTVPSPEYEVRVRQGLSTYGVAPSIQMWHVAGGRFFLPRGFMSQCLKALGQLGYKINLEDNRVVLKASTPKTQVTLRPHQRKPLESLLGALNGIYKAPPGSGKTVVCLELWRRAAQKAIVLVDKKNLLTQWRERARQHLGIEVGVIGDGKFDAQQPLTIALVQTLTSRQAQLSDDWYSKFGMLIVDECHHAAAKSWRHLIGKFPAKYRVGVSATPDRENGAYRIAELMLGPIVAVSEKETLYQSGTIIKPTINVIKTDFKFDYHPNHSAFECSQYSSCSSTSKHHTNNYMGLLASLGKCPERLQLITETVKSERGKTQLIISKRKNHLQNIAKSLKEEGLTGIWMLTGSEKNEQRNAAIEAASKGGQILLSTLADEALDIPELEVVHLTWPTKSIPLIVQQIGRVERNHHGKAQPTVYDYADNSVGVLRNQFMQRKLRIYSSDYTIRPAVSGGGVAHLPA